MVQNLTTPQCASEGCLPCFVALTIRAQGHTTGFYMRRIIDKWHSFLTKHAMHCAQTKAAHKKFTLAKDMQHS